MKRSIHGRYILKDKIPVPCEDLTTWGEWLEHPKNRIVRQEWAGDLWVSTVFLALDHDHFGKGPPLLFETMVFRDSTEHDREEMRHAAKQMGYEGKVTYPRHIEVEGGFVERSKTWELALEAHRRGVTWAKEHTAARELVTALCKGERFH